MVLAGGMTETHKRHVVVHLEFLVDDDLDPDQFGEDVLCVIERCPEFTTEEDGMLSLPRRQGPSRTAATMDQTVVDE